MPIEEFLYEYLRCNLVHEGGLPWDLHPIREGDGIMVEGTDGSAVSFSNLLLTRINDVVWRARENQYGATFPEMERAYQRIQRLKSRSIRLGPCRLSASVLSGPNVAAESRDGQEKSRPNEWGGSSPILRLTALQPKS